MEILYMWGVTQLQTTPAPPVRRQLPVLVIPGWSVASSTSLTTPQTPRINTAARATAPAGSPNNINPARSPKN